MRYRALGADEITLSAICYAIEFPALVHGLVAVAVHAHEDAHVYGV